jgi:hypothetical protein
VDEKVSPFAAITTMSSLRSIAKTSEARRRGGGQPNAKGTCRW